MEVTRCVDLFMAELSAVLSRGLRHVVSPPTATWQRSQLLHRTSSPYAKTVRTDPLTSGRQCSLLSTKAFASNAHDPCRLLMLKAS